jgi:hypothetical protein
VPAPPLIENMFVASLPFWTTCSCMEHNLLIYVICQLHGKPWPSLSTTSIHMEAGHLDKLIIF